MLEFINIFVKFSYFMSRGWAFDYLFCPEGRVFVDNDCPGGGGMVMDEIDTCITLSQYIKETLFSCRSVRVFYF